MQENLSKWEDYEDTRVKLKSFIESVETRSAKSPSAKGNQKVDVGKELFMQQVLLSEMENSKDDVRKLDNLTTTVADRASERRQEKLRLELVSIRKIHKDLMTELTGRVKHLEVADDKWKKFREQLNDFFSWLVGKEEEIQQVEQIDASPEEQFKASTVISLFLQKSQHL